MTFIGLFLQVLYDIMGQTLFADSWTSSKVGRKIYKLHTYLIENCNTWAFYPVKPWYNKEYRHFVRTIKELRAECGALVKARRAECARKGARGRSDALTMLVPDIVFQMERRSRVGDDVHGGHGGHGGHGHGGRET